MTMRSTLVIILALLGLWTLSNMRTHAQMPTSSSRLPHEAASHYSWSTRLAYGPSGAEGVGVDASGTPYTYAVLAHNWQWTLTATISPSARWRNFLEISQHKTVVYEEPHLPAQGAVNTTDHQEWTYSLGNEYRINPSHEADPRISSVIGHPWQTGLAITASILRDPVVLVGELGLRSRMEQPTHWITAACGLGFAANAWVRISSSVSLVVPVSGVGLPASTLGVRVRYSLSRASQMEAGVQVFLRIQGDQTRIALEVELTGRGP